MGDWESIFKERGKVFLKPQENMKKVIKFLKKQGVKRVLDLGCGSGRHTVMLAKAGFDVYSMDISKTGLKMTRKWLKEKKLKAKLKASSCYKKFPYKDNFFDAVISIQVIHHNRHKKVKFCISEIERVLRQKGVIFITCPLTRSKMKGGHKFKKIEPRTYIPLDGQEKGIPHLVYTKETMIKDFKNFKILDMCKDGRKHYCLLGTKK